MENNLFDMILSPEYWISEFEVINIDKLNLLIRVYKSIIDKGDRDLKYRERHHMVPKSFDEQRRKISESKIGNNYTKGKIWITNGMTSLLIDPCDAEEYYSEGFWRGRSRNKMRVPVTLYCDSNLRDVLRYAHVHDAGADVILQKDICIKPGTNRIPLGFNLKLPPGTMGLLFPRSSIMGLGIQFNCAPIDAEYTGEYNLICYNCTNEEINFSKGTKIVQLVIMPCIHIDNIETGGSHRGSNGIGSTGK